MGQGQVWPTQEQSNRFYFTYLIFPAIPVIIILYLITNIRIYKYNILLLVFLIILTYLFYKSNYVDIISSWQLMLIVILSILSIFFPFSNTNVLRNNASKGVANGLRNNNAYK